ncbi:MAG: TetR/AcrR family transcriptional regulator [Bacteroidota bacterium]|nr:TetR/AcrR family transcriptional regulator [Bacteroidota bacterium]
MSVRGRKPKPKDEIRDKLVRFARDIFAKYGFHKTNINDIALAGGRGKSTLYYYFSSKEDIYKAVIESELVDLREDLIDEVNLAKDPQSKIKAYVLSRINFLSRYKNLYAAIREQSKSRFSFTESIRQKFDLMEVQLVTNILNDGVKKGYFKIKEPEFAATGFIGALQGVQFQLLSPIKKIGFEKTLDSLLEILLFGLIK